MVRTPAGLEFWVEKPGQAPLTRVTNLRCVAGRLAEHQVRPVHRFATEFWDVNRFPPGLPRAAAAGFNFLWFVLRLPADPSSVNALVGEKAAGRDARGAWQGRAEDGCCPGPGANRLTAAAAQR
jgi:hypothetical protein